MNSRILRQTELVSILVLLTLGLIASAAQGGEACAGISPRVCVERADLDPPDPDTDFTFDLTDPDNPDVTFLTGHSTNPWRVWSQVSAANTTPDNLGDLFIDSSGATDNYLVEIKNPNNGNPGAANLGSAILFDETGWSGASSITEGRITGSLGSGGITVVDAIGISYATTLQIDGNVAGSISAETVKGLIIQGNLSGNITVSGKVSGKLEVRGSVDDVVIVIADIAPNSEISFNTGGEYGQYDFDADLRLLNGVQSESEVTVEGTLPAGRVIDLNDKGVDGKLWLGAGAGDIINGGDVAHGSLLRVALVSPDCENPHSFSGTATFANVDGEIAAEGANLDGLIHVKGYLNEQIAVTRGNCLPGDVGQILPDGKIWVAGDLRFATGIYVEEDVRGKIQIDGDIVEDGGIAIEGDLSGDIDIGGRIASGRSITIDGTLQSKGRILVDGQCSGGIIIGKETEGLSLIHLREGMPLGGEITINASEGPYDANGTIKVGKPGILCAAVQPQGPFAGKITIKAESEGFGGGDLTGLIDIGCLEGDVTGDIVVEQNMTTTGDIQIRKAATAAIDVKGALRGSAQIFVQGLYGGDLTIGTYTTDWSLIHLQGGLDSGGCVKINASEGDHHAGGTIHVGIGSPYGSPPPDITYYGSIEIEKEAHPGTGGGDLNGTITVVGCHDEEADPLDICIRGDENGTVSLFQTRCDPVVGRDCVGNCP